jgi:hypothetical protein
MGISLVGDIFGLVDSGGSCISTVAMVRACEAIQARLVATLSIVRELKVRVYGNTAVATYKDTYDIQFKGEHRSHTIIATDTFVKMGGEWKQVASHGASVAK